MNNRQSKKMLLKYFRAKLVMLKGFPSKNKNKNNFGTFAQPSLVKGTSDCYPEWLSTQIRPKWFSGLR
jgi:hypothetical protein